jgi:hypothetical protein
MLTSSLFLLMAHSVDTFHFPISLSLSKSSRSCARCFRMAGCVAILACNISLFSPVHYRHEESVIHVALLLHLALSVNKGESKQSMYGAKQILIGQKARSVNLKLQMEIGG